MKDLAQSSAHTLAKADLAIQLASRMGPSIQAFWVKLAADLGSAGPPPDFGALAIKLGEGLKAMRPELAVAALAAEIEAGRASRAMLRHCQYRVTLWVGKLRALLRNCSFNEEADSIALRRTYFRRIRNLPFPDLPERSRLPSFGLLQAIFSIEPKAMIEANLGLMAVSGFPNRPKSPQQERRKKRRRRRASPGAPTGSLRRNVEYEEEE